MDEWSDIVQVSADYLHTIGLKTDGTVVAVGHNEYGQSDVDSWSDIVQIVAGMYHTIGLKTDGTVVAVGDNEYGQSDLDSWSDIVQVAAGQYHTIGLKSDGTVVAVGSNGLGQCDVDDWDLDQTTFHWPVDQPYKMGPGFCDPNYFGGSKVHKGIDIMKRVGSPVYSVCDGVVSLNWTRSNYPTEFLKYLNSFLIIEHDCDGNPIYGYYGHIKSNLVNGTEVKAGDVVGYIRKSYDRSNNRTFRNDHLHFGLNVNYINGSWGIAPFGTACETLEAEGWYDPLNYFGW